MTQGEAIKRYSGKSTIQELIRDVAAIGRQRPGPVVLTFELAGRVITIEVRMVAVDGKPVIAGS